MRSERRRRRRASASCGCSWASGSHSPGASRAAQRTAELLRRRPPLSLPGRAAPARPLRLLARPRAQLPPWRAPLCRPRTGADQLARGAGGWAEGAGPGAAPARPPTWGCPWRASAGSGERRRPSGPTGRTPMWPWEQLTRFPALGRGWGRGRRPWGPRLRPLACPRRGPR